VAPSAVDSQKTGASIFRTHVDLLWPATSDDTNGSGLAGYWIYRDGLYLARTQATQFSDEAVASSGQYSYTIYAMDQHENQSPALP